MTARGDAAEVGGAFLKLGCISFGGPVAHLAYFHAEFVGKRRWLDDAQFGHLVALCQFLPGPASSQLVFALGMHQAGLRGAMLASACFLLPSAALMILFAYAVRALGDLSNAGWLHGLKVAAVAVVAQAVWNMGRKLCPDGTRIALALTVAAGLCVFPGALAQAGLILAGGILGWWRYRDEVSLSASSARAESGSHRGAWGALLVFAALLVLLPVVASISGNPDVRLWDSFYRAGSLVFGGGHVVLPLLRAELVPTGWIHDDAFLAGYGAAQAVPGPLFSFAAYLGTVIRGGAHGWVGGLECLLAIFLPAWLLIGGALPFWHRLRREAWMQAALLGANAAVVGVLLAAFYSPVWREGITDVQDVAAAVLALALLEQFRVPAWGVVLLAAAAGQWLL